MIVPAFDAINNHFLTLGYKRIDNDKMVDDPNVIDLINAEIESSMNSFSNFEKIKKFVLLPRLLTLEKGELTPTLKVVRKVVLENFKNEVSSIYN